VFLDPGKLLLIGVVALVVLGPDQLPKLARQAGSLWHDFSRWRASLDEQLRGTFPDLPSTGEIAAAVRSPVAFLDRLARESETGTEADNPAALVTADPPAVDPAAAAAAADPWDWWPIAADGTHRSAPGPEPAAVVTDAVSMN
jgi:hypothetical protein